MIIALTADRREQSWRSRTSCAATRELLTKKFSLTLYKSRRPFRWGACRGRRRGRGRDYLIAHRKPWRATSRGETNPSTVCSFG